MKDGKLSKDVAKGGTKKGGKEAKEPEKRRKERRTEERRTEKGKMRNKAKEGTTGRTAGWGSKSSRAIPIQTCMPRVAVLNFLRLSSELKAASIASGCRL
jgi:hypothetical protein